MKKSGFVFAILFAAIMLTASITAAATAITVTNLNDSGPGSLRQAIADAAPGDTIDFAVTGTITLTSGELVIDKSITIRGPGASLLSISGNKFYTQGDLLVTVTLDGMTIQNGYEYGGDAGGGIHNLTTMIVSNCTISGNTTDYGGGIFNSGVMTVTNSTVASNRTQQGGGGIYNSGVMTVIDSTVSGNSSLFGGGIYSYGTLTVSNSIISANISKLVGGISSAGSLTVTNSTISGNSGSRSAIDSQGFVAIHDSLITGNTGLGVDVPPEVGSTLTVSNSTISGNAGGGISAETGSVRATFVGGNGDTGIRVGGHALMTVSDSTITENRVGIICDSEFATVTLNGSAVSGNSGGGIVNEASLTITNSTVSGNQADTGGAIKNNGSLTINNSTISGNIAWSENGGGNFGGIFNESGTTTVNNGTIYGNESAGSYVHTKFGDKCADGHGGGIGGNGQIVLTNTIVAGNRSWSYAGGCPGGSSFPEDIGAVVASASHNLISDAASSGGIQNGVNGNIVGADPGLGPLQNNGGATLTRALSPGSPAINAGDNCVLTENGCGFSHPALVADQRGMPRNGTVDMGAFERQANETSFVTRFDFDGDGRADVSLFRPADATWYLQRSRDGFGTARWGFATDKIVPADYDGDGKTDVAVYRPSEGNWYALRSSNGTLFAQHLGGLDDVPSPADFDSDGLADVTVYRPSTGGWFYIRSTDGGLGIPQFGTSEDRPVVGDYNGDGRADVGVFRPSNGTWYWSSYLVDPSHHFNAVQFGVATDVVTPADLDGDGRTDVAVYRPSTGIWYCLNSSTGAVVATQFGLSDDIPVAADFDGDTRADITVFRPSSGVWYRLNSGDGSFFAEQFGANGDRPIPAAFGY